MKIMSEDEGTGMEAPRTASSKERSVESSFDKDKKKKKGLFGGLFGKKKGKEATPSSSRLKKR